MNDPHTQDTNSQAAASELSQMFQQAIEQQRALWEQAARVSRDESLRFASLRLKRTNQALENVQGREGLKGMIQVQQDWLRDLVQDYTAQGVRFSETMSRLAAGAMARTVHASREAMQEGQDVMRQTREAASENLDTMRQAGAEMMQANHQAIHAGVEQVQPVNGNHQSDQNTQSQDHQSGQDFQSSQEYH
jgi:hypothetical protein